MTCLFSQQVFKVVMAGWLCLTAFTPVQAQSLLTLQEALQIAIQNNPDIRMARHAQRIAAQNHHIGQAGFLPTVDAHLRGLGTRHTSPQETHGATVSADLGLQWNLFNGFQSFFRYKQLGERSHISQLQTKQTMAQKAVEVTKSYYGLALALRKQQVIESCLAVSQEVWALTQMRYEIGECTHLDYLTAQVEYQDKQSEQAQQADAVATAQLTLRNLLGGKGPEDFVIEEDIPRPTSLSWEALASALATANPSLLMAQKRCEEATLAIKLQQGQLWPRIDFSVGYDLLSRKYQNHGWEAASQGLQYGVTVTLNLFHAFQHKLAIQEASIQADNAQIHLAAQQTALEARLKQSFERYAQQQQRYELAQQHVQVSQESEVVALEQYRLGRITLLELNQVRQKALETLLKCLQATYDAKVTEIALKQLGGILLQDWE